MERKLSYKDKELVALMEDKLKRIDVLYQKNEGIQALLDERDTLMLEFDEVKIKIMDKIRELSKSDRTEFEVPSDTKLEDGVVEVVLTDMLKKAEDQLRNTFVEAKKSRKKQDKKRKKKK